MPQLDPGPWLTTLTLSWLVFLVIIPPKVMAFLYPNDLTYKNLAASLALSWHWPWQ